MSIAVSGPTIARPMLFLARAESPQFARNTLDFDVEAELKKIAEYFEGICPL